MKKNLLYLSVIVLLCFYSCSKNRDSETPKVSPNSGANDLLILKSGAVVQKRGNLYVWQGDILLSETQLDLLDKTGSIFSENDFKNIHKIPGNVIPTSSSSGMHYALMPNARAVGRHPADNMFWSMVRYTLNSNLSSASLYYIQQAMAHWEATTNVRFYNATGQPTVDPAYGFAYPYIEFIEIPGNVSSSFEGRKGGKQLLEVAAIASTGTLIHEIGHAIGLYHEQNKQGRNDYITIDYTNLPNDPNILENFREEGYRNYYAIGAGIDFGSIMMYNPKAFAVDTSREVIKKKDGTSYANEYQRNQLSDLDRAYANTFYLPFKARVDTYRELADIVYKPDNSIMTPQERLNLQAQLNNGNPNPPPAPPAGAVPIHVYYNSGTNVHDYVVDGSYYWNRSGWIYKGVYFYAFPSQIPGSTPVYRYYAYSADDNQWSISTSNDYNYWTLLNIPFYAYSTQVSGTVPIYLFKNVQTQKGHFLAQTYSYPWPVVNQNIAFYAFP